ncbi:MAG: 2-oxoacid:acceptor oxidoreductase family protein, partial [Nitrospirota bacterium]|nr:2-oxoacid:acceptor oxidoreductase family protein [Nitrospirota bacterium]
MDYTIRTGGEAGQGIHTIGNSLARVFARAGFHVFTHQDYESRVRGGHNFYQIRCSDKPVTASRDSIDILVALDKESIIRHEKELSENGLIVYDSSALRLKHNAPHFLDVPFTELALKHGKSRITANTVATGSVLGMLGMAPDILYGNISRTFGKKGGDIVQNNQAAAKAGYEFALKNCSRCSFELNAGARPPLQPRMLMAGNDAIGL